jgi:hypothetical protein
LLAHPSLAYIQTMQNGKLDLSKFLWYKKEAQNDFVLRLDSFYFEK